jgi:hypothetical protein
MGDAWPGAELTAKELPRRSSALQFSKTEAIDSSDTPPMELGVKSGNSSMLPLGKPSDFVHNIFSLQRRKRCCLLGRLAGELTSHSQPSHIASIPLLLLHFLLGHPP